MKLLRKQEKRNMKMRNLTNREWILIVILTLCILFWLSFRYIVNPQLIKISTLENQIENYTTVIDDNNKMFKNENIIIGEKIDFELEREKLGGEYFMDLNQSEIVYVLNELFLKSKIEIDSINFSKVFIEELNDNEIQKIDISVPFKSDFESFIKLIDYIEKEPKKIVINNFDIEKSENEKIIGNISLGIYSLSQLTELIDRKTNIETIKNNKSNPFIPYRGYIDPIQNQNQDQDDNTDINEDDEIIKPETEDLKDDKSLVEDEYDVYKTVKGDNISYISMDRYGTEKHVDEILKLNNMIRPSILPIGKEIKLLKK